MPAGTVHHADPGVSHGVFQVLPRTDGRWIVYDPRRPIAKRTVRVFKTMKDAALAAERWHEEGHG